MGNPGLGVFEQLEIGSADLLAGDEGCRFQQDGLTVGKAILERGDDAIARGNSRCFKTNCSALIFIFVLNGKGLGRCFFVCDQIICPDLLLGRKGHFKYTILAKIRCERPIIVNFNQPEYCLALARR